MKFNRRRKKELMPDFFEKAIFGCMMINPDCIEEIVETITHKEYLFSNLCNNEFYDAIVNVWKRTGKAEAVEVRDVLKERGMLGSAVQIEDIGLALELPETDEDLPFFLYSLGLRESWERSQ